MSLCKKVMFHVKQSIPIRGEEPSQSVLKKFKSSEIYTTSNDDYKYIHSVAVEMFMHCEENVFTVNIEQKHTMSWNNR